MDDFVKKSEVDKMIQYAILNYMRTKQYTTSKIPNHTHNGIDSSPISRVELAPTSLLKLGLGGASSVSNSIFCVGTGNLVPSGSASEQVQLSIGSGKDWEGDTFGTTGNNLQLNLLHQPNNTANQSFITAFRPPLYSSIDTTSVTSGGTTIAVTGYNFTTNSLANALINIFNSAGTLIETQTIASNTASVITISGTWTASTNPCTFEIFQPVFMGSANYIFQRFYTQEGTGGGIRFGVGPTAGGQNGLLYMSSSGDLFWRTKTGTSVGASNTQFDITNPAGTTFRYTFDGTGTDPSISAATFPAGTQVTTAAQNFSAGNNGTFIVTASGSNYFEVTNASGVAENNKTIGTGSIKKDSVKLN